jgi:uncharacterized membrane-anchored protein YhcB (DUF1043 family)
MSTLSWLELMLLVTVVVGALMYHFGHAIGREQQKIDVEARRSSMRNHPSNHIRIVKE